MSSALNSPGVHFRLDTQHHVLELMRRAVDRISGSVDVQINRDSVHLSGYVDSWHMKQYAQESIRQHAGERVIQNSLAVHR